MNSKPDCYKCKHRKDIVGDAHSSCGHSLNDGIVDNDLLSILAAFASPTYAATGLGVTGDPHGIQNGWFNWPWNFDPIWLLSCGGFEEIE